MIFRDLFVMLCIVVVAHSKKHCKKATKGKMVGNRRHLEVSLKPFQSEEFIPLVPVGHTNLGVTGLQILMCPASDDVVANFTKANHHYGVLLKRTTHTSSQVPIAINIVDYIDEGSAHIEIGDIKFNSAVDI